MGYTRYWNRTDKPYDEDFVKDFRIIDNVIIGTF